MNEPRIPCRPRSVKVWWYHVVLVVLVILVLAVILVLVAAATSTVATKPNHVASTEVSGNRLAVLSHDNQR